MSGLEIEDYQHGKFYIHNISLLEGSLILMMLNCQHCKLDQELISGKLQEERTSGSRQVENSKPEMDYLLMLHL